jgi:hypothetical protein
MELDRAAGVIHGRRLTQRAVVIGFDVDNGWWVRMTGTRVTLDGLSKVSLMVILDIRETDSAVISVLDELEALKRGIGSVV